MGYASAAAPARNGPLTEYLQAGRSGWMDNSGFTGGYEPLSESDQQAERKRAESAEEALSDIQIFFFNDILGARLEND